MTLFYSAKTNELLLRFAGFSKGPDFWQNSGQILMSANVVTELFGQLTYIGDL